MSAIASTAQLAFVFVEPTADVLRAGARSAHELEHQHVPPMPGVVHDPTAWLAMLDFAEDARRYNQAPCAVLDLTKRDGAGSNGPIGGSGPNGYRVMANGSSVAAYRFDGARRDEQRATWPQLLAGRREQRAHEPEIARARDLAEAYRLMDYYGHVYGDARIYGDWTPVPLIAGIAREIITLGGDPSTLEPRTEYMADGVRRAVEAVSA